MFAYSTACTVPLSQREFELVHPAFGVPPRPHATPQAVIVYSISLTCFYYATLPSFATITPSLHPSYLLYRCTSISTSKRKTALYNAQMQHENKILKHSSMSHPVRPSASPPSLISRTRRMG